MPVISATSLSNHYSNGLDSDPIHSKDITPGKFLGAGLFAEVYEDQTHPGWVLKISKVQSSEERFQEEVMLFNRYYGEGSAVLLDDNTIRMKKIEGIPLSNIKENIFPATAIDSFNDMICKLGDTFIMHADFHMGNIIYDPQNNTFNPIDLTNDYDSYFSQEAKEGKFIPTQLRDGTPYERYVVPLRDALNKDHEFQYNKFISFIIEHMT
ncbi:hypothetical protein MA092_002958 [Salmonella enterica]|nr:hypothetical protein [Salmonella enterica]